MIRIQKLKQPKKTSGLKLTKGQSQIFKNVEIRNLNSFAVYVDFCSRKKQPTKKKESV